MTLKTYIISVLFTLASLVNIYSYNSSYPIEDHYDIRFSTSRAEGTFKGLNGVVNFYENDLENSTMDVSVDVATINTGNKTKDKHARKSKWFDAKKYPNISFKSESIIKTAVNSYSANGLLTIKDVTESYTIKFSLEKETKYLIGSTTIDRERFNIKGNSFAFLVGEIVFVDLSIPANYKG